MDNPLTRVTHFVHQFDPSLTPIIMEEEMHTAEEAATAIGIETAQIAKSILFRSKDRYGLFVLAGDKRLPSAVVKQCLGGRKQKMATIEEVLAVTGFQIGAVCPFALREKIPIFIDTSLQRFHMFYTAAGVPESLLELTYDQLATMTKGTEIEL
ncbi:YbaK/EbsC family protein [Hazenella sp. IB182353]|uniref:YbaK/EbsC family protein n=1 Tax=Polycladospora coralii TaxID=2771432 RepID=UPI001747CB40|nr:YbaK/EbsC family protein [Polycladospora coralii]MBS7531073.1 YbaK/EbsC family protein [Polycladospora coralii]